jgi:hypothetical protein
MLKIKLSGSKGLFGAGFLVACFLLLSGVNVSGADYDGSSIEWKIDAGLEKERFEKLLIERCKAGMRVVDFEQYRSGRVNKQAAIWVKSMPSDEWLNKSGLMVTEFKKENEDALKRGFVPVDIEVYRTGATLHFGGVWLKNNEGFETEMQFGMSDLMFSNRYGEMADRGYRLIDFEVYEANGKNVYAAIWKPRGEELVRFYRGLTKEVFGSVSATLREEGFRLSDIEGYYVDGRLTFACGWVSLEESQKTDFAYHMMADEFYQRNASMMMEGYRLTDIEAYDIGRGELRYAGSWTAGAARVEAKPIASNRNRDIFKRPN